MIRHQILLLLLQLRFTIPFSIECTRSKFFRSPLCLERRNRNSGCCFRATTSGKINDKRCRGGAHQRERYAHLQPLPDTVSICRECEQSFASRNSLFRHIKNAHTDGGENEKHKAPKLRSQAFLVGYHGESFQCPMNTIANQILKEAFMSAASIDAGTGNAVEFKSMTQSTEARSRHHVLAQETGCSSIGDVIVISYRSPSSLDSDFVKRVSEIVEELSSAENEHFHMALLSATNLPQEHRPLHAERSCTQLIYHYVLPMRCLPHYEEVEEWWAAKCNSPSLRSKDLPPPDVISSLKRTLKSAQGRKFTGIKTQTEGNGKYVPKLPKGRYGLLADNELRAWHNFADPSLMGLASPNHEPVWRALDRARFSFVTSSQLFRKGAAPNNCDENEEVFAIIEFRGDAFVPQQVRRIMGSVVAILHNWLPEDFVDVASNPDVVVETPVAPDGFMYIASSRYHFFELVHKRGLFNSLAGQKSLPDCLLYDSEQGRRIRRKWENKIIQQMTDRSKGVSKTENGVWLNRLRDETCPRIRKRLASLETSRTRRGQSVRPLVSKRPVPVFYQQTLSLLRTIVKEEKWPGTSIARARVMTEISANEGRGGSFTLVNPGHEAVTLGAFSKSIPLANTLFPELAMAVFKLEEALDEGRESRHSRTPRPPSTHCAINCNAEFTPHVDSGQGAGQSLSMIVGLGDYSGGEISVEGTSHYIQYQPLEFDGWKMRHWTEHYEGQRFSLVWFTPAST
jgi:tRNA U38,U39,U40 pseudouridine synthase TruA